MSTAEVLLLAGIIGQTVICFCLLLRIRWNEKDTDELFELMASMGDWSDEMGPPYPRLRLGHVRDTQQPSPQRTEL